MTNAMAGMQNEMMTNAMAGMQHGMMSNGMAGMQNRMVTNGGTMPPVMQAGGVGNTTTSQNQAIMPSPDTSNQNQALAPPTAGFFQDQAVPTQVNASNQVKQTTSYSLFSFLARVGGGRCACPLQSMFTKQAT